MAGNIEEIALIDLEAQDVRPGDTGLLSEISGLHDYLEDKLIDLSTKTKQLMAKARHDYYVEHDADCKFGNLTTDEQIFTSMKTGKCRAILR